MHNFWMITMLNACNPAKESLLSISDHDVLSPAVTSVTIRLVVVLTFSFMMSAGVVQMQSEISSRCSTICGDFLSEVEKQCNVTDTPAAFE
jgi:hypothetical protein